MAKSFRLELLDIPYFCCGLISDFLIPKTAKAIRAGRRSNSRRSYDPVFARMKQIIHPLAKERDIAKMFADHADAEWAVHLTQVAIAFHRGLRGNPPVWYGTGRKDLMAGGIRVKPAIRGIAVRHGEPLPIVVNPRATLDLGFDDIQFLARGAFELHGRDNPSVERTAVWDVSRRTDGGERVFHEVILDQTEMMPLDEFEDVIRRFLEAVALAGYRHNVDRPADIIDLFRRP